jgi:DNA-binding NtrC family response regulator
LLELAIIILQARSTMQIGVESSRAVQNKRIFVVDTDEIYRAALQFMLHDDNETHEVADLDEALTKAQTSKPDLILLARDIVQSRGIPVLKEITDQIPGVKLIVVAEADDDQLARSCLRSGAHAMISKPLDIQSVRDKVDQMLGRKTAFAIQFSVLG